MRGAGDHRDLLAFERSGRTSLIAASRRATKRAGVR